MKVFFAWFDFWIGFYYDRKNRVLYFCPFPCVVFQFGEKKKDRLLEIIENCEGLLEPKNIILLIKQELEN
jgi:hypothetical protein